MPIWGELKWLTVWAVWLETSNPLLGNAICIHLLWQMGQPHPPLDYKSPNNCPFPLNQVWRDLQAILHNWGFEYKRTKGQEGNLSVAGIWNSSNYCALLLLLNEKASGWARRTSCQHIAFFVWVWLLQKAHNPFAMLCLFISSYRALRIPSTDKIPALLPYPHLHLPEGVLRVPPSIWINKVTGEESVSLIKATQKGLSINFPLQTKNVAK